MPIRPYPFGEPPNGPTPWWLAAFQPALPPRRWRTSGGAPLLGVNEVCMISHGRSTAKAIKNAIRAARECVANKVIPHIREGIALG